MTPQAVSSMLWSYATPFVFLVGVPTLVVCFLVARVLHRRIDPQAKDGGTLLLRIAVFALRVVAAATFIVLLVSGLSAIG